MTLFAAAAQAIPVIGSSSGVFQNPVGPGGMVTTGVGTDHFTWGRRELHPGVPGIRYHLRRRVNQFHVLEGGLASAQLLGRITDEIPQPIPEPGTMALFGAGMVALGFAARRRIRK